MTTPLRSADPVWLRRVGLGLRLHSWVTLCALALFGAVVALKIAIADFDRRAASAGATDGDIIGVL